MSEKIYTCLLRLFPSAFRRLYTEEALRLFRERLRDETGIFRRLRLIGDLLADFIGALPQAYKNSYVKAAPVASLTFHFDGVPSFQVLSKEPIRRETIVFASVLSLTALAAFVYVMELPGPYHHAGRNGRISPIEAVLEQLNQPLSADVAGGVSTDVSGSASTDANRPVSATDADTRTPATTAIDISGEWTVRIAGGDAGIPRWFIFRQNGAVLSGTGGSDSAEQYPIIHGLVAGDSVRFEVNDGRTEFLYDMKGEGREIWGTLSIRSAGGMRVAKVRLERTH
jgi:hypothetical protein